MRYRRWIRWFAVSALLLALTSSVGAQGPMGTAFTYQGRLTDGGTPANGSYDLRFLLYDAAIGGSQVGSTINLEDVTVTDGLFAVKLDFGSSAFAGEARHLEIAVRPGASTDAYTVLSPRVALTATPYALYAASVGAHDHLGETWVGSGSPLVITGTFGIQPNNAALVLGNSSGDALQVNQAGWDGVRVYDAGGVITHTVSAACNGFEVDGTVGFGLYVGYADHSGVFVEEARYDGVHVEDAGWVGVRVAAAGSDGISVYSAGNVLAPRASSARNGVEVAGAEGNGLYVGYADADGVRVEEAADHGLHVASAGQGVYVGSADDYGMHVYSAGLDGVFVSSTGRDGVVVLSAGSPSTTNTSADKNGLEVAGAEGNGLYVGYAGNDGVSVYSAADDGVYVRDAQSDGVFVGNAEEDGVEVGAAGNPGTTTPSLDNNGIEVAGAEHNGLYVGYAGNDGVQVKDASVDGLKVDHAGRYGIYVMGSEDMAGRFQGDVQVDGTGHFGGGVAVSGDSAFVGDVTVTGYLAKLGGGFRIDHPLDPENKYLQHSFVESPDMMNVYNGNVTTDEDGYATVLLPDYFEALNKDYRYQLTAIGTFAQAIIAQEVEDNQFVIQTDKPNVKVSWQVTGIRQDPYAEDNRIVVEEDKPPEEQGTYLYPEGYGLPEERGLAYNEAEARGVDVADGGR